MIQLSIIIVNWHSRDYLRECLASILGTTRDLGKEVIVIDNGSYDGAGEMIAGEFPSVMFIQHTVNGGFSAGNNIGFSRAEGTYILMLNPDTIVRGGAVRQMVKFLEGHPAYGAVGCRILSADGVIDFHGGRKMPTLWSESVVFLMLRKMFGNREIFSSTLLEHWDHASSRDVQLLSGSCMMFRREVLGKLGGMDEGFFMYGEDMDFCHRMMKVGWKLRYFAEAEVMHHGSRSTSKAGLSMNVEGTRSMKRFFTKHRGMWYALEYLALLGAWSVLNLLYDTIFLLFESQKQSERKERIVARSMILRWLIQGAR